VFSLYGEVRRPTDAMMDSFDVLLVDLQDLGCRIYTFITTLRYVLEAAARTGKAVWVLDRPNPAGRPVEGTLLRRGWESFVGAGPMPMRHGMTMGELGHWFMAQLGLKLDYRVITMEGWQPDAGPDLAGRWASAPGSTPARTPPTCGWPAPMPAPSCSKAPPSAKAGAPRARWSCLAPPTSTQRLLDRHAADGAPMAARLPPAQCWFEPTFHKHAGQLCAGVQIHVEDPTHYDHEAFRPWRLQALAFKALRSQRLTTRCGATFPYEYEHDRLAIDLINGGPSLREWVDDPAATRDLDDHGQGR
jgi:hypothetical protein